MTPAPMPTRQSLDLIARFYKRVQWAAVLVAVLWLCWKLSAVLTPFAAAAFLGWLGDPLVDRMEARGIQRNKAVTVVFVVMLLAMLVVLLVLVPVLQEQISTFVANLPKYRDWFIGSALPLVERLTGADLSRWLDADTLINWVRTHWQQAGGFAQNVLGMVSKSGFAMLGVVLNLVLIPILAFFFLRDWDKFTAVLSGLVPRDHLDTFERLSRESSDMLSGFMRGQLLVMIALAVLYSAGLMLLGLDLAILIGLIAGVLTFIPYVGPTFILVAGTLAALSQYGDWQHLAGALAVWGVGQLVESYWLTPKLVGDRIGLHPVAVMFAVMAGGSLFGFFGMLIALPAAAVINVLLGYARERYVESAMYIGDSRKIIAVTQPPPAAPGSEIILPSGDGTPRS